MSDLNTELPGFGNDHEQIQESMQAGEQFTPIQGDEEDTRLNFAILNNERAQEIYDQFSREETAPTISTVLKAFGHQLEIDNSLAETVPLESEETRLVATPEMSDNIQKAIQGRELTFGMAANNPEARMLIDTVIQDLHFSDQQKAAHWRRKFTEAILRDTGPGGTRLNKKD